MDHNRDENETRVKDRTFGMETSNRELRRHIEEQTLYEERLRASEEAFRNLSREFQAILDAIPDILTLLAPGHRLIWANRGAARSLGMGVPEIVGKHCYGLWHKRSEPCENCPVTETFRTGDASYREVTTPDGRVWELRTVPVKEEDGTTVSVVELGREITEQKWVNERLRTSLREKEILLKELNHRTKNNLQVIASLLSLQSHTVADPEALGALREAQDRIRSISLVHEKLYRSRDVSRISLKDYIGDLAESLLASYHRDNVGLRLDVEDISVSPDIVSTCGLVLSELVSNSLKYAFADRGAGEISISVAPVGSGSLELRVADNGIGFPQGFDFRKTKALGLRLVVQLVEQQLGGTICLGSKGPAEFVIRFPGQGRAEEGTS